MQALERILAVIESASRAASAVSPTRVAEETGLSLSTVVRLMQSLVEEDVLVRSSETGQYRLGHRLVSIVARATQSFDYRVAAQTVLEQLRDATGETASLHMLQGQWRVCVAAAYTTQAVGRIVPIGLPFPVVGSAAGHSLLSQLDQREVDSMLEAMCDPSRIELARAAVADVRDRGFAMSVDDSVAGVRGIAVPVGTVRGMGCVSVSGPSWRFDANQAEAALAPLRKAISILLTMHSMSASNSTGVTAS